ncbi:acyl carrier protein [Zooshikella marina]|uniref:acyl carrier protein n=1 Tax=Zooshikella ganghwensis TaxID=202772 RepID=UPI001BAEF65F|nr:acyl carrier protein [Zooshikella ganghwensis]MBU2707251.1 acyl carrier protein [Zooshikella ganghwensis]
MDTKQAIFEHVKTALVDKFEVPAEAVCLEATLYEDLDLDSIDAVDLIITLQDYTKKKIQPESFKQVRTIRDLIEATQQLMDNS